VALEHRLEAPRPDPVRGVPAHRARVTRTASQADSSYLRSISVPRYIEALSYARSRSPRIRRQDQSATANRRPAVVGVVEPALDEVRSASPAIDGREALVIHRRIAQLAE
jgi:hypothetical protein